MGVSPRPWRLEVDDYYKTHVLRDATGKVLLIHDPLVGIAGNCVNLTDDDWKLIERAGSVDRMLEEIHE